MPSDKGGVEVSDRPSLADRAVSVLANIETMGASLGTEDPHRHLVWSLQESAKAILSDAFCRAQALAYLARDAERMVGELREKKGGSRG